MLKIFCKNKERLKLLNHKRILYIDNTPKDKIYREARKIENFPVLSNYMYLENDKMLMFSTEERGKSLEIKNEKEILYALYKTYILYIDEISIGYETEEDRIYALSRNKCEKQKIRLIQVDEEEDIIYQDSVHIKLKKYIKKNANFFYMVKNKNIYLIAYYMKIYDKPLKVDYITDIPNALYKVYKYHFSDPDDIFPVCIFYTYSKEGEKETLLYWENLLED